MKVLRKRQLTWMCLILAMMLAGESTGQVQIRGADVSYLDQLEQHGAVYRENGTPHELISLFQSHGINWIRLRLWHTPAGGINDLASTIRIAQRAKQNGMQVLLDFHFSDTWADPGQQAKPAAWGGASFTALRDSIRLYVRNVITAMRNQNALPDIVQFGNEITCGMLWNEGRICDPYNTTQQWHNLGALLQSSQLGLTQALLPGDSVRVAIHIDRGGDSTGTGWFFDHLLAEGVRCDIIALSYYPFWQGTLEALDANLRFVARRYNKPIILAETAYPWTLAWSDTVNNIIGLPGQLLPAYPATVDGQRLFLTDLMAIVQGIPSGLGLGVFYWGPENISVPGVGSVWENVTLFDFNGELLNSIQAFQLPSAVKTGDVEQYSFALLQNFPNPFNPSTTIRYSIPRQSGVVLSVVNVLGEEVERIVHENQRAGYHEVVVRGDRLASGVYVCRLQASGYVATIRLLLIK